MSQKIQATDKKYLTDRINEEFSAAEKRLVDALIPIRRKAVDRLRKELKIESIEKEAAAILKKINEISTQYREATGSPLVSFQYGSSYAYLTPVSDFTGDTPISRRIDDEVNSSKEAAALRELRKNRKELIDKVQLAGFEQSLIDSIKSVPAIVENLLAGKLLTDGKESK